MAPGSLRGPQTSTKQLPESFLLPHVTNCFDCPRTEEFLGHRTFGLIMEKFWADWDKLVTLLPPLLGHFTRMDFHPLTVGQGRHRWRVRMVPRQGNKPPGPWQEETGSLLREDEGELGGLELG